MSGWEIVFCGYFSLIFMYLKFLIIWRFFRIWALFDSIFAVENMPKCIFNNCTFRGFWQGWHASINVWIIRYVYKPLGARESQNWTIWIIFFFIGLWHDVQLNWIAWALLNCVFFSLENFLIGLLGKKIRSAEKYFPYRILIGLLGALNLVFLALANLAIMLGFDGSVQYLYLVLFYKDPASGTYLFNYQLLAGCLGTLFVITQIQLGIKYKLD